MVGMEWGKRVVLQEDRGCPLHWDGADAFLSILTTKICQMSKIELVAQYSQHPLRHFHIATHILHLLRTASVALQV